MDAARGQSPVASDIKRRRVQLSFDTDEYDSDEDPHLLSLFKDNVVVVDAEEPPQIYFRKDELVRVDATHNKGWVVREDFTTRGLVPDAEVLACGSNGCVLAATLDGARRVVIKFPVDRDEITRHEDAAHLDLAPEMIKYFEVREARRMLVREEGAVRNQNYKVIDRTETPNLLSYAIVMPLLTPVSDFKTNSSAKLLQVYRAYEKVLRAKNTAQMLHSDLSFANAVVDASNSDAIRLYLIDWDDGFLKAGWARKPPAKWMALDPLVQVSWLLETGEEQSSETAIGSGMFKFFFRWARSVVAERRDDALTVLRGLREQLVVTANALELHAKPERPGQRRPVVDDLIDNFNERLAVYRPPLPVERIGHQFELDYERRKYY